MGKRHRCRSRSRWRNYTPDLAWYGLGVETAKSSQIAEKGGVFGAFLHLPPLRIYSEVGMKMNRWLNFILYSKIPLWKLALTETNSFLQKVTLKHFWSWPGFTFKTRVSLLKDYHFATPKIHCSLC